jgi:hypothetical protein
MQTLDLLGDEILMRSVRQSLKEARAGRTIPWEEVKQSLDL